MNRKVNSGPYVVYWSNSWNDEKGEEECQDWTYACQRMRFRLLEGHSNVSIRFA